MKKRIMFRMSKKSIVSRWISDNRKTLGIGKQPAMFDCKIQEINDCLFSFDWAGVTGTIECGDRVKPSTLKFTSNI